MDSDRSKKYPLDRRAVVRTLLGRRGDMLVVGWGSTYGAISQAVRMLREQGRKVSHLHLRNIWPLPEGVGDLLRSFGSVLVPELNNGQLVKLLRAEYLVDAESLTKIAGQPFRIGELVEAVEERLNRSLQ